MFFFTYCVFELPSNLMLKKLRPSRWLPLIMVAWGIVMVRGLTYQDFIHLATLSNALGG